MKTEQYLHNNKLEMTECARQASEFKCLRTIAS